MSTNALRVLRDPEDDYTAEVAPLPAPRVPRDGANDYTPEMAAQRRAFLRDQTGADLEHVGSFSFDPGVLPGNVENFSGVAQVPIGVAGPLRINGEHAQGDFYVPLATLEGTLVASYNRGMRVLSECGGVKTTVVEDSMQRAPVFIFDDAMEAREFGAWIDRHEDEIRAVAEATTRSGKLTYIGQYQVGPLLYLRVNFTTGDAAGQNMTAKATHAACEWMRANYPGGADYRLTGAIDTDKKHSHINMLLTRGKRVVAEAVVKRDVLKRRMGVDTKDVYDYRQIHMLGGFLAGSASNSAHAANGITADVHRHRPGRRQHRRITGRDHLLAAAGQRRLLLVDHADQPHRGHLRRRHRPSHAARVPRAARLLRQGQGAQARRDLRRHRARRRDLPHLRGPRGAVGDEPRAPRAQPLTLRP